MVPSLLFIWLFIYYSIYLFIVFIRLSCSVCFRILLIAYLFIFFQSWITDHDLLKQTLNVDSVFKTHHVEDLPCLFGTSSKPCFNANTWIQTTCSIANCASVLCTLQLK